MAVQGESEHESKAKYRGQAVAVLELCEWLDDWNALALVLS
jgi:hypothetical protein